MNKTTIREQLVEVSGSHCCTAQDVAAYLGVCKQTARNLLSSIDKIQVVEGGAVRYAVDDVAEFLARKVR